MNMTDIYSLPMEISPITDIEDGGCRHLEFLFVSLILGYSKV